jgi:hypothetical protein
MPSQPHDSPGNLRHFLRPLPVTSAGSAAPALPASRDAAAPAGQRGIGWLAGVALAFTAAVLLFTPLRTSLAWDETVYASQISTHVPMLWSAERARGMPLLIAPVTLLTSSATVLRVYLTLLAGLGLFLALLCWRRLRPDWVLGLAGLVFAGLWIVQSQASQVYPNFWIALGALAGTGLFLRAVAGLGGRVGIVLLGVAAAFTSMMRPPDALALFCPLLLVAAVIVLAGRADWRAELARTAAPAGAIVAGLAVGIGEWIVEAYLYFGGPLHRLKLQSNAVGGTKFDPVNSLRILSGGRASSVAGFPTLNGWSDPWLLLWWLAFVLIALGGIWAMSRKQGWLLAVVPVFCAACEYFIYSFPARDATRYLQPSWALVAISAADGLAWLLTRPRSRFRPVAIGLAAVFLVVELTTQHAVLTTAATADRLSSAALDNITDALRQDGVRPSCLVTSVARPAFVPDSEPVAYGLGCTYKWTMRRTAEAHGRRVIVLVQGTTAPFAYAQDWPARKLPGAITAYIEPTAG